MTSRKTAQIWRRLKRQFGLRESSTRHRRNIARNTREKSRALGGFVNRWSGVQISHPAPARFTYRRDLPLSFTISHDRATGRLARVVRTLGRSAPGRARSPREMGKISIKSRSVGPCSRLKECGTLWRLQYLGDLAMPQGTVKWFNPTKGYGFIQPQEGGKDVFVHISAVERAGLSTLNEGQTVQYELVENRGKTSAENLKVK